MRWRITTLYWWMIFNLRRSDCWPVCASNISFRTGARREVRGRCLSFFWKVCATYVAGSWSYGRAVYIPRRRAPRRHTVDCRPPPPTRGPRAKDAEQKYRDIALRPAATRGWVAFGRLCVISRPVGRSAREAIRRRGFRFRAVWGIRLSMSGISSYTGHYSN